MRILLVIAALTWASTAHSACRQALALGLDVSGSVDEMEYRLQLDGLAGALMRPEVRDAFLALPDAPVRLYIYEWAGQASQRILSPWAEINTTTDLASIVKTLRNTPRIVQEPPTAIGQAMLHAGHALSKQPDCWRHTLDLSGDGRSNTGPRPRDLKAEPLLANVTINGLVVGSDSGGAADRRQAETASLWAYYKLEIIRGPQAFVEVATGFEDFENAMARKLLKELQTLAVSHLQD